MPEHSNLDLIDFEFAYVAGQSATLSGINLSFASGEFALICGPTGSGKSTLLKSIMGIAPSLTGGNNSGLIRIRDPRSDDWFNVTGSRPQDLAHLVGYVGQQPERTFVAETVELELVFGMEQLGFSRAEMRDRVSAVAEKLQLTDLLEREPSSLSSGQAQRAAIGAALAAGQRILLLDEPTSALDDASAESTIALIRRLCDELGITALMVEHRVERVVESVDSVTLLDAHGAAVKGNKQLLQRLVVDLPQFTANNRTQHELELRVSDLTVEHGDTKAVDAVSFELFGGEIVGLRGANGSGKTSLLWAIQGVGPKSAGEVWLATKKPIALVPQTAGDLLFLDSVAAELIEADRFSGAASGATREIFERLVGGVDPGTHPRDLSAGQQLALALGVQLVKGADLILLDEPTSALDYNAKAALCAQLAALRDEGKTVLIASHDSDFLAALCYRILTLESGRLLSAQEFGDAN
ncbi:MAG: ATP-binding cassette domain-containing protein [Micrococcales bacterium]